MQSEGSYGGISWEKAMGDTRKKETHHIEAAREWLDGAKVSFERENDVRGDLRVMLAKAELAHVGASEKTRRLKRGAMHVLPAIVAAATAAVIFFLYPWEGKELATREAETVETVQHVQQSESPAVQNPAVQPAQQTEEKEAAPVPHQQKAAMEPSLQPQQVTGVSRRAEEAPAAPQVQKSPEKAPTQKSPALPDTRVQKLMTQAGTVLRK